MKRIAQLCTAAIALLLCLDLRAQVIYLMECDVPCHRCKFENPMKVEYRADPVKNVVLRIIQDSIVDALNNCTVLDSNNWVCPGIDGFSELGKQSAVNGVARWVSSGSPRAGQNQCTLKKTSAGGFTLQ